MDWTLAIDRNREALKRVLAALIAMVDRGQQSDFFRRHDALAHGAEGVEGSRPSRAHILSRRLHRAVLRLLRPTESAVRRLVIIAARDLVVKLPPLRKPDPKTAAPQTRGRKSIFVTNGIGTGIVLPEGMCSPDASLRGPTRTLALPLTDPLRRSGLARRRASAVSVPRISVPGLNRPVPVRPRPSPRDAVDASRLVLRLQALGRALDDLPAQAKRFARWRARCDEARAAKRKYRIAPLRGGRPPGSVRRPTHEIHTILEDIHGLAFWVLEQRVDTS